MIQLSLVVSSTAAKASKSRRN